MSKAQKAKTQLAIVEASIKSEFKKTRLTRERSTNTMRTHLQSKNYPKAYECLTMVCSSFDKESALNYISESLKVVSRNLPSILESKICTPTIVNDVAALCYASTLGYFEGLSKFVDSFFVPQWTAAEVKNLAQSNLVPRELSKLKRPDAYTLEELHFFAQECERSLQIDMTWFYENYPINKERPPETKIQVSIAGKAISSTNIQPPAATPKFVKTHTPIVFPVHKKPDKPIQPLPEPRIFKVEEFIDMENDIAETLKKWTDSEI